MLATRDVNARTEVPAKARSIQVKGACRSDSSHSQTMMSQAAAAPTSKPKRITLALVQRECIVSKDAGAGAGAEALATQGASHDDVDDLEQLASLRTIDLSWQNIGPTPEGLDFLAGAQCHLRELYLQSNAITSIGDAFDLVGQSLELLSLSDNLIVELEGLSHLHKLRLLDLSNNRIDALDVRELPSRSLRILNLSGNPCMCPHSDGSIATDASAFSKIPQRTRHPIDM